MAHDWRIRTLGELTENFDSLRIPVKEADRRPGPYPYYGASGVVDYVDDYLFEGEYLLIAEDGENLRTRKTPVAYLARGKFWVNNHAHIVRGNREADTRFLMYYLAATDISGYLTGSTMPKLTQGNMNLIRVVTPPVEEQRAIASALGALDDKIELNRRMSETLETIARELYRAWFVDFADGPAASRELAGELPAGWFFGTLADVAELSSESWQVRSAPNAVQYVDLANVKWGRVLGTVRYQWGEAPSRARRILRTGDTIVGTVRPGNGSYAQITQEGLTGSTGFAVLRPKATTTRAITYLAATDPANIERLAHLADGAAYPAVRPPVVHKSPMTVPDQDALLEFSSAVDPLLNRISVCEAENKTLAELRDALLPKLISGELRIPKAEQLVSEVA